MMWKDDFRISPINLFINTLQRKFMNLYVVQVWWLINISCTATLWYGTGNTLSIKCMASCNVLFMRCSAEGLQWRIFSILYTWYSSIVLNSSLYIWIHNSINSYIIGIKTIDGSRWRMRPVKLMER